MKSFLVFSILILVLTACRHAQSPPERRSTDVEIGKHITGKWMFLSDASDGDWYPTMILASDGSFVVVHASGTRMLLGNWEYQDRMLKLIRTPESVAAARAAGWQMNEWDYFSVVYADEHELVITPGVSVAGRLRFKR